MAARLPADALVARVGTMGFAVVPDPGAPGRRAAITHGLAAVRCALGPTVAPDAAAISARLAQLSLLLPGEGLVIAEERRIDLMLSGDEALADGLVASALGPLEALGSGARGRLEQTLDAWLRHQGEVRLVAAELHVHAQTVRYRLGRLRELLGDRLAAPDGRLELELALRARRLSA